MRSIAQIDTSKLGDYIGIPALKPFINKDLILGETIEFHIPGTQLMGRGNHSREISRYLPGVRSCPVEKREIAIRCSILPASCAKIGLVALIGEAAGYQYERVADALSSKMVGKMVLELIYDALNYLKNTKTPPRYRQNYHQWLTEKPGLKALVTHMHQVISIAKTCPSMSELREKVAHYYRKETGQLAMHIPDKQGD